MEKLGLYKAMYDFAKPITSQELANLTGTHERCAIMLARKGKLDLSIALAASSGTQVAIFVVPTLVIAGIFINRQFNLVFTIYELAVVFFGALISHDGKGNWFEGIMLIAVYIIVAVGFFFIR